MPSSDIRSAYDDVADALAEEHAHELRDIESDALAFRQSIADRAMQTKKASILDRLFKRSL
jgi:hypothetical protein